MTTENNPQATTPQTPLPSFKQTQRARRGHDFFPSPETAATIPGLRESDPDDAIVHAHYAAGSRQWWVAEYNPFSGEAWCLFDDGTTGPEWGLFSLTHLEEAVFPQADGSLIPAAATAGFAPVAASTLLPDDTSERPS